MSDLPRRREHGVRGAGRAPAQRGHREHGRGSDRDPRLRRADRVRQRRRRAHVRLRAGRDGRPQRRRRSTRPTRSVSGGHRRRRSPMALRRDGEWHGEVENVRKDGTRIWCWANVSSFDHAEHGIVWVAVQTDVTERREAEHELRHAEERFRKVFEEGPVGIVMFGDDLAISDGNDAFCRITGYSRDELIGRSMADVTHPADVALEFERTQRVFSGQAAELSRREALPDEERRDGVDVVHGDRCPGRRRQAAVRARDRRGHRRAQADRGADGQAERAAVDGPRDAHWPSCSSRGPASLRQPTWSGAGSSATCTTVHSSASWRCGCGSAWPRTCCGRTRCAAAPC